MQTLRNRADNLERQLRANGHGGAARQLAANVERFGIPLPVDGGAITVDQTKAGVLVAFDASGVVLATEDGVPATGAAREHLYVPASLVTRLTRYIEAFDRAHPNPKRPMHPKRDWVRAAEILLERSLSKEGF